MTSDERQWVNLSTFHFQRRRALVVAPESAFFEADVLWSDFARAWSAGRESVFESLVRRLLAVVAPSLPVGFQIVAVDWGMERDETRVLVEHESFPQTPEGMQFPRFGGGF